MSPLKPNYVFDRHKKSIIDSNDLSRKGNIDDPIVGLINFINGLEDYVTTSSCSGRIIVLRKFQGEGESRKKECKWILTSHTVVHSDDAVNQLASSEEKNMILKFEPFILHVKCRDMIAAKKMQDCALAAGYRNSGTVFGRNGSITLAVRGTLGLEVPLSNDEGLIVSNDYLKFVINIANDKMCENLKRIDSFSKEVYGITVEKQLQETNSLGCNTDS